MESFPVSNRLLTKAFRKSMTAAGHDFAGVVMVVE